MNSVGDVAGIVCLLLLFMAFWYGVGYYGTAAVEYAVRGLLFLCKGCPVGVDLRPCTRCARVAPCLLYRHGRWTCLVCETRHTPEVTL